jgi:hypothetical protein
LKEHFCQEDMEWAIRSTPSERSTMLRVPPAYLRSQPADLGILKSELVRGVRCLAHQGDGLRGGMFPLGLVR